MKKYALALDLKADEQLIREYDEYHRRVWPEIRESIIASGVQSMEIYRVSNRLFMIMEVNDDFTFEHKAEMDAQNPKVQEWEALMWKYQQALPSARQGEKWQLMERIFKL
ncbi:L-rhamnose mutarotase [Olivibacter sitiensis]|uniref:L-rhamnose mutarotase n=1 Tax=Olivibacter sitiensis TaxID=376470 RepID=UPI00040D2339|nr:L-rhamnose mutarotase [Olivibacter sitiensis]